MIYRFAVLMLAAASCAANPAPKPYEAGGPTLKLTASRKLGLPGMAVELRAALGGLESEEWYCRPSEWTWPNGTRSTHVEDCVPWAAHTPGDYTRVWTYRGMVLTAPGKYTFEFRLIGRDGRALATATADVEIMGDTGGQGQ